MPTPMLLEVRSSYFVCVTAWDGELKQEFPVGSIVRASITKDKSRDMERFYWGLVTKVGKATGIGKRPLSNELLFRTGFVDELRFMNGEMRASPMSIGDMSHSTFREFVDAAIEMICREYIADMPRGTLLAEVGKMVGIAFDDAFGSAKTKKVES